MSNCLFSKKRKKKKGGIKEKKYARKDVAEKKVQACCATDAVLK